MTNEISALPVETFFKLSDFKVWDTPKITTLYKEGITDQPIESKKGMEIKCKEALKKDGYIIDTTYGKPEIISSDTIKWDIYINAETKSFSVKIKPRKDMDDNIIPNSYSYVVTRELLITKNLIKFGILTQEQVDEDLRNVNAWIWSNIVKPYCELYGYEVEEAPECKFQVLSYMNCSLLPIRK